MRVAIAGVSHFHTHYFVEDFAIRLDDQIVGVSDPMAHHAEKWAAEIGITPYTDYRQMCEETKPELVFVFGRPDELAETAEYLINAGIPSVIEKPAGINIEEIRRVKELAEAKGTFTTVPFSLRYGLLAHKIQELSDGEELTYASIRVISGLPDRYVAWELDWNLDPLQCGGGSTLNIGSQYFDLLRYLAPSATWTVKGATMSNEFSGIGVEDYSAVLLESGGLSAVVETGYLIPEGMEVAVSICVGKRVFRLTTAGELLIRDETGAEEVFPSPITQAGWYPLFIADTVARVSAGESPAITMDDMLQAALLAESAYRMTSFDDCMRPPVSPERAVMPGRVKP